jgi:membrane protein implicated in regulation of membrane protease activity
VSGGVYIFVVWAMTMVFLAVLYERWVAPRRDEHKHTWIQVGGEETVGGVMIQEVCKTCGKIRWRPE